MDRNGHHGRVPDRRPDRRAAGPQRSVFDAGGLRSRWKGARPSHPVLHHGGGDLQRVRLPRWSRMGLRYGRPWLLHHGLPGARALALVDLRTQSGPPRKKIRISYPGRSHVGPLFEQGTLSHHRAGKRGSFPPVPHAPDHGCRLPFPGRDGRQRSVLARGSRCVRHSRPLRVHQRLEGHRLDQRAPGHHHGRGRVDDRAGRRLPLLRRCGLHVQRDTGQGPRVPYATGRGGRHELGRLLDGHPRQRDRVHHVAASVHEVLRRGQRENHQEDHYHLPALRVPPHPYPHHRLRGHLGLPGQPAG